jgi:uncharacterized protein (DUF1778 family)
MIYMKTELGQAAFQSRSAALTPRQRSAFIMFDGKRSTEDVLKATTGLNLTAEDIGQMVSAGLLAPTAASTAAAPQSEAAPVPGAPPTQDAQAHYSRAYPIAIRLTSELGLRGFRLNLAVEGAGNLAQLRELAPRIKDAVGPEKFRELQNALYD